MSQQQQQQQQGDINVVLVRRAQSEIQQLRDALPHLTRNHSTGSEATIALVRRERTNSQQPPSTTNRMMIIAHDTNTTSHNRIVPSQFREMDGTLVGATTSGGSGSGQPLVAGGQPTRQRSRSRQQQQRQQEPDSNIDQARQRREEKLQRRQAKASFLNEDLGWKNRVGRAIRLAEFHYKATSGNTHRYHPRYIAHFLKSWAIADDTHTGSLTLDKLSKFARSMVNCGWDSWAPTAVTEWGHYTAVTQRNGGLISVEQVAEISENPDYVLPWNQPPEHAVLMSRISVALDKGEEIFRRKKGYGFAAPYRVAFQRCWLSRDRHHEGCLTVDHIKAFAISMARLGWVDWSVPDSEKERWQQLQATQGFVTVEQLCLLSEDLDTDVGLQTVGGSSSGVTLNNLLLHVAAVNQVQLVDQGPPLQRGVAPTAGGGGVPSDSTPTFDPSPPRAPGAPAASHRLGLPKCSPGMRVVTLPIETSVPGPLPASDDSVACIACLENHKCVAMLPCRHLALCGPCSEDPKMDKTRCPICREIVSDTIALFL